jgi:hypothetical protein
MRTRTAVCLCVAGAVLTFAVSGHPAAVDIRLIGEILMLTGAVGLWPGRGRAWLLLGRVRLRRLVDQVAPVQGVRVPLDDLLRSGRRASPAPGACLGCAGGARRTSAGFQPPAAGGDQG